MTKDEMMKYAQELVHKQGTQGAIVLAPLLQSIIENLFADPATGVAPIVINIEGDGNKQGTTTRYEVTTEQSLIDTYIAEVNEEKASARLFVQDGDVLIAFPYLEITEDTISGIAPAPDGTYKLILSTTAAMSYFEHDDEVKSIASVTEAEIDGYREMFGAVYNPATNKFGLQIGTVHIDLTPGQMMLTTEEYNKVSNDADYTAMWANAIAEYICCAPWFDGFSAFKLHSAFYNASKTIFIDLNRVELPVANLTSAFSGCSRLEQITGTLVVTKATPLTDAFKGCAVLHTVKISGLSSNLDLADSPQLSPDSMQFIVENAVQPGVGLGISIYVHPTVRNNIFNNSMWTDVLNAIQEKPWISFEEKMV